MPSPKTVRNWFFNGVVDGVRTPIATGPTGKDGGFSLNIHQRKKGRVSTALRLRGHANLNDTLTLEVEYCGEGQGVSIKWIDSYHIEITTDR